MEFFLRTPLRLLFLVTISILVFSQGAVWGEELATYANGGSVPGYVIITTDAIVTASTELESFRVHKISQGFDVHVITEADFGGGVGDSAAENIRAWLQDHYLSDNIEYVLLIGNPHPN